MADVLGHDIDGRPLRVGDEVVLLDSHIPNDPDIGRVCRVIGRCPVNSSHLEVDIPHDHQEVYKWLSLIHI